MTRSDAYRWLSAALQQPTAPRLLALSDPDILRSLRSALSTLPAGVRGQAEATLDDFVDEVLAGPQDLARRLAPEHAALFFGPGPVPCSPYESVWADGGQVMGASTFAVQCVYEAHGLAPADGAREAPDHAAVELEFMAWLITRPAVDPAAAQAGLAAQRAFLEEHPGRWLPAFAARLRAEAASPLFRFTAEVLPAWLAHDRNLLEALDQPAVRR